MLPNRQTLSALHVRWLTEPAAAEVFPTIPATQVLQRVDYPIPPEIGHAWLERLPLAHGISLFRGIHRFRPEAHGQLVPLGEFSHHFPEPTLVVQTIQGATVCHQEFDPRAELTYQPGCDFFRRADRFRVKPLIEASADSTMTALILVETVLAELVDEDVAEQLIRRIGLDAPPAVKVLPMPLAVSAPLQAALAAPLRGTLQRLFAQSKVLEYLCALCAYAAARESPTPPLQSLSDRLQELHQYLTQLEGRLPSLEELAVRFRMSARRLNTAFAERYGLTIYAFIADWRLNEAYVAIRDSDVELKVLASRLGYSHVNHFNRAFRSKFGHPPGQLRRGRIAASPD
jgi:AraC-like DNA-binding protein